MLSSIEAYSRAVYTLLDQATVVQRHTVRIYPRGAQVGVLEGRVEFDQNIVLRAYERIDFARQRIMAYSYEVWRAQQQLYWYDPTPHPNDSSLASTHPHHKHVPPDVKHHRIPAPGLSFTHPNLPFLLQEIKRQLLRQPGA
jgi:hypothetical protein